jgi:hypothetical protein
MTQETFEDSLRGFLRGEPFQQFIVELLDGQRILIDAPHTVAMGGGAACFMSPDYEFSTFSCEQVRDIRLVNGEVVA